MPTRPQQIVHEIDLSFPVREAAKKVIFTDGRAIKGRVKGPAIKEIRTFLD